MTYLLRTRRNPVADALATRSPFDRFFEESFCGPLSAAAFSEYAGLQALALDVYAADDKVVVEAALPGFNPDDVDISIEDNVLTIKAETKQVEKETQDEKKTPTAQPTYYLRERRAYNLYKRTITLPAEVKAEAAEATFNNGMLKLTLPKAETPKPKRIEVKTR